MLLAHTRSSLGEESSDKSSCHEIARESAGSALPPSNPSMRCEVAAGAGESGWTLSAELAGRLTRSLR
jgi:hypothetical protein